MRLSSQRIFLAPLAAAIVGALALVSFAPAQPGKQPVSTKLPKPVVILGKGTAHPSHVALPKVNAGKGAAAKLDLTLPDSKKLASLRPQKLSASEKIGLLRSIDKNLLKNIPKMTVEKSDFNTPIATLDPQHPWAAKGTFIRFGDVFASDLTVPAIGLLPGSALYMWFQPAQAGSYLIIFNVSFLSPKQQLQVQTEGGKVLSGSNSFFDTAGPAPLPVVINAPDANLSYNISVKGVPDDPKANVWQFYSVDIQVIGQKK